MIGNRVVLGLLTLCAALAGCIGAPFTAGDLGESETVAGDGGSLDPLTADAGAPPADGVDARADAGAPPAAKPDAGGDAGSRVDGSPTGDAGSHVVVDGEAPPDAAKVADAGPSDCDGGPVYLHHVGLDGLTWQDCVPTGTYDATEALAACAVYAAATGAVAHDPALALCNLGPVDDPVTGNAVLNTAPAVDWTYDAADYCPSKCATGHVAVLTQSLGGTSVVTSSLDPEWD